MLEQQAIVTRRHGEQVFVKSLQTSACSNCHQQDSCTTTVFAKFLPNRELPLSSSIELKEGDKVLVGMEESHFLRASIFTYMLPLLVMLFAVGIYDGTELISIFAAIAGLFLGLWLVHILQHRFLQNWITQPRILSKC